MAEGGVLPQRVENPVLASTEFKILLQDLQSGKACLEKNSEGHVKTVYTRDAADWKESGTHTIHDGGTSNEDIELKVKIFSDVVNEMKRFKAPAGLVIDSSKTAAYDCCNDLTVMYSNIITKELIPGPVPLPRRIVAIVYAAKISSPSMRAGEQAQVSEDGKYREGHEFECPELKEVLGSGSCAGDVVVVKDIKTGSEHALKTVMISNFSAHELRCWIKLNDSNFFPSLYIFHLDGSTIKYHMEKIKGETLTNIIFIHMKKLRGTRPHLVRPFSLTVFQGLLSAVQEIHYNEYVHTDVHSENVLLNKETMTIKVLDFGHAEELGRGSEFNHSGLKSDFLGALGLFLHMYAGIPYEGNSVLEKRIKTRELENMISQHLTLEDRKELLELIILTYGIISNPLQAGYGDPTPICQEIENIIFQDRRFRSQGRVEERHEENPNSNRSNNLTGLQDKMAELLKEVAIIFFPEMHSKVENVTLNDGQRQTDIEQSPEEGGDLDEAAALDPTELLTKLKMSK